MDDGFDGSATQDTGLFGSVLHGVPLLFGVAFLLIALVTVAIVVLVVVRAARYAAATPQTAEATCIGKRTHVSGGSGDSSAHTRYFATFELADGSRKELAVSPRKIGLIAEGDRGTLTWRDVYFQDLARR